MKRKKITRVLILLLSTVCLFGALTISASAEITVNFKPTQTFMANAYDGAGNLISSSTIVDSSGTANLNYVVDGDYVWPLPSNYVTISSLTGGRLDPIYGTPAQHNGIDISCPIGTKVVAAHEGEVIVSQDGWNSGRGYYVQIRHDDGSSLIYQHLNSRAVSVGEHVEKGQTIGYSGTTGHSTGGHLHFELWLGSNMSTIGDPIKLYPSLKLYYGGVQINP